MNRKHQIAICKECLHQKFTSKDGLICGLTNSIQTFEVQCADFHQNDVTEKSVIDKFKERDSLDREKNIDEVDWNEHKVKMAEIREEGKLRREEIRQEYARKDGMSLEQKSIKSGANWFYIIAALSIVNSILVFNGSELNFIFGLGITTLIDSIFRDVLHINSFVALIPQMCIAVLFFFFGYYGKKSYKSAYLSGLILYSLDALVFLLWGNYLAIGFHAFALISMIRGIRSIKKTTEDNKENTVANNSYIA